jgi:hypothetical protein
MTGHVCMDVRDMCDYCERMAEAAYEGAYDAGPPAGWDRG